MEFYGSASNLSNESIGLVSELNEVLMQSRYKISAFSLIEVLIALVILSFAVMGSGKLLLESTVGYRVAEQQAEAMIIASAIADSVAMDSDGVLIQGTRQYWQNKLDSALPGSSLMIEHQQLEDKCVYTIVLSFGPRRLKTITLTVVV
jgi:prepilin-type N-terminal cleavage/methylation domain-containing protein